MAAKSDVIVLGTGGVGSAALFHLARRGVKAIGIDRFPPGHDRGSSHGESRMIRLSYFEHPNYVPLLRRAYDLWDELGELRSQNLFHRTGLLYFGDPNGVVLPGIRCSAVAHGLEIEEPSVDEARRRFPGFVPPEGAGALFEADAGYLLVEDCVRAQIEEAVRLGARHFHGETVLGWSTSPEGVVVETDKDRHEADRLIIAAGCWAGGLMEDLGLKLRTLRKHLHWHAAEGRLYSESNDCPCFFFEAGGGYFYGFPDRHGTGVKVAEHSGGLEMDDPLNDSRAPDPDDDVRIASFLGSHLPGVSKRRARHEVCFYTMSPDEHFIVDRHPEHPNVSFAAGLSGHGFKFTSALGEVLADLALNDKPRADIGFLRLDRPGL